MITLKKMKKMNLKCFYYTEENEKDEFKVFLFHLIHLVQCHHGSETIQQILNNEEHIFH